MAGVNQVSRQLCGLGELPRAASGQLWVCSNVRAASPGFGESELPRGSTHLGLGNFSKLSCGAARVMCGAALPNRRAAMQTLGFAQAVQGSFGVCSHVRVRWGSLGDVRGSCAKPPDSYANIRICSCCPGQLWGWTAIPKRTLNSYVKTYAGQLSPTVRCPQTHPGQLSPTARWTAVCKLILDSCLQTHPGQLSANSSWTAVSNHTLDSCLQTHPGQLSANARWTAVSNRTLDSCLQPNARQLSPTARWTAVCKLILDSCLQPHCPQTQLQSCPQTQLDSCPQTQVQSCPQTQV